MLGRLGVGGHYFNLITAVELLLELRILAVHLGTDALAAQFGVNVESKIEHGSPFAQLEQITFGGEHKHLVFIQVHLELIHDFHRVTVGILQCLTHGSKPFVESAFSLDAFVTPVSSQSALGNLVHAPGTYLHLHPFALGAHHRNVQRLIAVAFGNRQPVAQTLGVGLVHIRYDGVHLPALLFLLLRIGINDDANGEEVVNAFERCFLLLYLVPDGVYRLGSSLDFKGESGVRHLLLNRLDERGDVLIARGLRFVELILYKVIGFLLGILEVQVFQFRLDFVQAQLVRQRSVEVRSLVGHTNAVFLVGVMLDEPHDVHTVGYHNKYHPHIFGE